MERARWIGRKNFVVSGAGLLNHLAKREPRAPLGTLASRVVMGLMEKECCDAPMFVLNAHAVTFLELRALKEAVVCEYVRRSAEGVYG